MEEYFDLQNNYKLGPIDISVNQNTKSLVEKYFCEEKYIDVLHCVNRNTYSNFKRCDIYLEFLGKCIYERMRIEESKKSNLEKDYNKIKL